MTEVDKHASVAGINVAWVKNDEDGATIVRVASQDLAPDELKAVIAVLQEALEDVEPQSKPLKLNEYPKYLPYPYAPGGPYSYPFVTYCGVQIDTTKPANMVARHNSSHIH